jgi:hypothetical protein
MSLFQQIFGGDASGISQLLSSEQQAAINRQSMMALGAKLLQGSRTPQRMNLAQGIGQGLEAGLQAQQAGQMSAVQQMLLGQKVREAQLANQRTQKFSDLFGGGATEAPAPAAPLTPEQALLASPDVGGRTGPTTQRADMIGAAPATTTAQARMPAAPATGAAPVTLKQFVDSLPLAERQALSVMDESEAMKTVNERFSAARKFGSPQNLVIEGQPRVVQFNELGEMREVQGAQPYSEMPADIRAVEYLYGQPLAGSGPQGVSRVGGYREQIATRVNMGGGGLNLTPGQEAVDKDFAKSYIAWQEGGGADTIGNLAQIGTVLQRLESGQPLTGPMVGIQPDFVLALTRPDAAGAKEQVQEVVQRNLRVVLGAQFTEKEGNQLISRAYNPSLPPEQNAARLRKLFQQMALTAQQRQAMSDYYELNGTLKGYKGPRPKINDFYEALQERSAPKAGDVVGGFRFRGGNPNDEANWERAQ